MVFADMVWKPAEAQHQRLDQFPFELEKKHEPTITTYFVLSWGNFMFIQKLVVFLKKKGLLKGVIRLDILCTSTGNNKEYKTHDCVF